MAVVEDHDLIITTPASRLNPGAPAVSCDVPGLDGAPASPPSAHPGGEWESSGSLKIEMPAKDTPCHCLGRSGPSGSRCRRPAGPCWVRPNLRRGARSVCRRSRRTRCSARQAARPPAVPGRGRAVRRREMPQQRAGEPHPRSLPLVVVVAARIAVDHKYAPPVG